MRTTNDLSSFERGNYFGFRRKDDLREHISKTVMPSYRIGSALEGEDLALIMELLARHPRYDQKVGVGIQRIVVEEAAYGNRRLDIVRADSSREDFSYLKCMVDMAPERAAEKRLHRALRNEIEDQTHDFKLAFFERYRRQGGAFPCPITGELTTWISAHVDHTSPNTFEVLVGTWLERAELMPMEITIVNVPSDEYKARLDDRHLADDFWKFHCENAVLRVISKRANLSDAKIAHHLSVSTAQLQRGEPTKIR